MSVHPHKYSVGPVRIFRGKSLSEQGCKKQHIPPCLYPSISNIHHGKGQQSCKCHCSSTSQHWGDTKSTRIHSNNLCPWSVAAESQM